MRMQTLCKQGYGVKAIVAAYPLKNWKLSMLKKIYQRVNATGSATERKAGSGQPKYACSVTNIEHVKELISSQGQSGQHLSTCEIAAELDIRDRSVRHIAKKDVHLNVFHQVAAQVLNAGTKQKRL